MKHTEVLKRLNKAVIQKRIKLKKWNDDKASIEAVNIKNVTDLKYQTRLNYFTNYKDSCGFNPETCEAHSYRWYSLARRIKGVQVLNSYRYSNQTSKHISKMRDVFSKLKIKYVELDAPRGLQDLDSALTFVANSLATAIVAHKYARIKYTYQINNFTAQAAILKKFGKRLTKKLLKKAIADAECYRRSRLERQKEQRDYLKKLNSLEIVVDAKNKLIDAAAFHVVIDNAWAWTDENEFVGRVQDYDKRRAVHKGFTKIIVHKNEPRRLSIVEGA